MSDPARFSRTDFLARAKARLLTDVPAAGVDLHMPARRSDDDLNSHLPPSGHDGTARLAAVLVGLIERRNGLTVLLTRRTEHLPSHPGQVALPGGKISTVDDGPAAAALRETEEETGVAARFVQRAGFLDAYQTRTGFRIVPMVGLITAGFSLTPEPGEVADVFEVPLKFLMNPANHLVERRTWQGTDRLFYAMPYREHYIWGVTAGILRNFYERVYRD